MCNNKATQTPIIINCKLGNKRYINVISLIVRAIHGYNIGVIVIKFRLLRKKQLNPKNLIM